jgi:hypothetical protein
MFDADRTYNRSQGVPMLPSYLERSKRIIPE